MPVTVAEPEALAPFFNHLAAGGTHIPSYGNLEAGASLDDGNGEPYYGTQGLEFTKGVVYEDYRMDLCKMVVGPDYIGALMESLRTNEFVRHFLLGNNIIGPVGAREIARFIDDFPDRMDTWYLAGNCIDGESLHILVNSMVRSTVVTNVWLKRNPLGPRSAPDVFRLITQINLRTLDLDQTELGDSGVAELFSLLTHHVPEDGAKLPLKHIYLNGLGVSAAGARAISSFLASPYCQLTSLYLSCNPLGDEGAAGLASSLAGTTSSSITRLVLESTGLSSSGAITLCEALRNSKSLALLDLGQGYGTRDLGQAYNYVEDAAVAAIVDLVSSTSLQYLDLGHCAIAPAGLRTVSSAVAASPSMLYYKAYSILPDILSSTVSKSKNSRLQVDAPTDDQDVEARVRVRLEANVRQTYGQDMSYTRFLDDEKRWVVSDKVDVRKIDSVYRTRDMGLARRGVITLVKDWQHDDGTLDHEFPGIDSTYGRSGVWKLTIIGIGVNMYPKQR